MVVIMAISSQRTRSSTILLSCFNKLSDQLERRTCGHFVTNRSMRGVARATKGKSRNE